MSNADQPQDALQEPDPNRSRCWLFTANLNIQKPLNAVEGSDPISPDYFNKVIDDCFPYQDSHLNLEVLSFSFNTEWAHLMSGNALGVFGFIVNKSLLSRRVVEKWLTHEGLDVHWSTCRRDKDPRVTEFLTHSALPDDFFAAHAGGGADRVPSLRVDKIGHSAPKKAGRPPKRPQPDAGFNDAGGASTPDPARARPAPADSTPPGAAAAAGARAASGPPPSPAAPAADRAAPAGDPATTLPTPARLSDASSPAGARGESGLERLLAEFQKTNQRIERLIGVIECIGRDQER